MTHFPEWMDATERRICDRFLTSALWRYELRAHDGEEWATGWTRDRASLQRQFAQTDSTTIAVRHAGGAEFGQVVFVHGNGQDVISDYAWNPKDADAETLLDAICGYSERPQ